MSKVKKWKNETKVSLELIRNRVSYNPDTGEFIWKPCGQEWFLSHHGWKVWHGKFAGKPVAKQNRGYTIISISVDGVTRYCMAHRAAWAMVHGAWPEAEIDHINGDRSDNRIANLRLVTHQQNQWNKGVRGDNATGFNGVHVHSQNGNYVAQITLQGRTKHLGVFDTAEAASAAYQSAARKAFGEFAPA